MDALGGLSLAEAGASAVRGVREQRVLDETAETPPAEGLEERTERLLIEQQARAQQREAHLDRIRMRFDASQKEHAELLREMNALRDMATEQMKQDDANLKKWIALI